LRDEATKQPTEAQAMAPSCQRPRRPALASSTTRRHRRLWPQATRSSLPRPAEPRLAELAPMAALAPAACGAAASRARCSLEDRAAVCECARGLCTCLVTRAMENISAARQHLLCFFTASNRWILDPSRGSLTWMHHTVPSLAHSAAPFVLLHCG